MLHRRSPLLYNRCILLMHILSCVLPRLHYTEVQNEKLEQNVMPFCANYLMSQLQKANCENASQAA